MRGPARPQRIRFLTRPKSSREKSSREKTSRQKSGALAEDAVARLLEEQGFEILRRNMRLGHLEIDIVAKKDDLCIMCEVRARGPSAFEGPLASIASGKKRMHLLNAADRLWRFHLSKMEGVERMRIDVAGVTFENGQPKIDYIKGALSR